MKKLNESDIRQIIRKHVTQNLNEHSFGSLPPRTRVQELNRAGDAVVELERDVINPRHEDMFDRYVQVSFRLLLT